MTFQLEEFESPIGTILLASGGGSVRALEFGGYEARLNRLLKAHWGGEPAFRSGGDATGFRSRVSDYFAGDLHALDALPVETAGTPFQESVWRALRQIPVGHTWTYGQLAGHIGKPRAVRAAGHANSLNPIGIIVPCHRVIGANSSLTGYAGGIERKQWLLQHEGAREAHASGFQALASPLPPGGGNPNAAATAHSTCTRSGSDATPANSTTNSCSPSP